MTAVVDGLAIQEAIDDGFDMRRPYAVLEFMLRRLSAGPALTPTCATLICAKARSRTEDAARRRAAGTRTPVQSSAAVPSLAISSRVTSSSKRDSCPACTASTRACEVRRGGGAPLPETRDGGAQSASAETRARSPAPCARRRCRRCRAAAPHSSGSVTSCGAQSPCGSDAEHHAPGNARAGRRWVRAASGCGWPALTKRARRPAASISTAHHRRQQAQAELALLGAVALVQRQAVHAS